LAAGSLTPSDRKPVAHNATHRIGGGNAERDRQPLEHPAWINPEGAIRRGVSVTGDAQ
jgi:hypothetical protein